MAHLASSTTHIPALWPVAKPDADNTQSSSQDERYTLSKTPLQPPIHFDATAESLVKGAERIIQSFQDLQNELVGTLSPANATFANTILPFARLENEMLAQRAVSNLYDAVSPDSEIREAAATACILLDNFKTSSALREDMYNLVQAVQRNAEVLDPESDHLLIRLYQQYSRQGLQVPAGPQRDRFRNIQSRLSELRTKFFSNKNSEGDILWLSLKELDGVPERLISNLESTSGGQEGKIRISVQDLQNWFPIGSVKSEKIRRLLELTKLCGYKENRDIFKEVLMLRAESARLLGYKNHATFRIEEKMAKTPEAALEFLSSIQFGLAEAGKQDIALLKDLKKSHKELQGEPFNGGFYLWDVTFYHMMLIKDKYSYDSQLVSEYFPLEVVVMRALNILQRLFGLRFVSASTEPQFVWHEDVRMFEVWNDNKNNGDFIGYLYMDLFARDGKYGNASHYPISPGFSQADGSRHFPSSALLCSYAKPTTGMPCLLRHGQVVTFFHELGHGIHDLVSKTAFARFHGPGGTSVDFGELPSQLLENWCFVPSVLKELSQHYSAVSPAYLETWREKKKGEVNPPPETIPDDLIAKISAVYRVNNSLEHLNQILMATFDLKVHQIETAQEIEALDIATLYSELRRQIYPVDMPQSEVEEGWGNGYASFGHLMGEYDAGYYSYTLSQAYATDIYKTLFNNDPMDTDVFGRYRREILEKGGSRHEMELLKHFLGREPDVGPFCGKLGIVSSI